MAIQMRRGEKKDFKPERLKVGEFAVPIDTGEVYIKTSENVTKALATLDGSGKLESMPTAEDVGAAPWRQTEINMDLNTLTSDGIYELQYSTFENMNVPTALKNAATFPAKFMMLTANIDSTYCQTIFSEWGCYIRNWNQSSEAEDWAPLSWKDAVPLPIENGGTGANTASAGLANLHGVEMTTSNLTYYVSPDGSDSNSGTSAASPFKTLAYALSQIPQYIGHTVTINVAAGTYNEACEITGFCGSGTLIIEGNSSAPNQYIFKNSISVTGNHCYTRIKGITAEKGVAALRCSAYVVVNDCVLGSDSSRNSSGFYAHYAFGDCSNCTIKNVDFAVQCLVGALCYSDNNTISNCSYAFVAYSGIILHYRLNGSPTAAISVGGCGGLVVGAAGAFLGE